MMHGQKNIKSRRVKLFFLCTECIIWPHSEKVMSIWSLHPSSVVLLVVGKGLC